MKGVDYAGLIGSLLHACNTRPDIQYAVNTLAAHMSNPGCDHWQAARRVLAYLRDTSSKRITYSHKRIRHVDLRRNFVREAVEAALVKLEWLPTALQLADILTKALDRNTFETLRAHLLGEATDVPPDTMNTHAARGEGGC